MTPRASVSVALGATAAAVVGLLWWSSSRATAAMGRDNPLGPDLRPVLLWPGLKVGTVVLIDTARAPLPPELRAVSQIAATVDMVLSDRALVAVSIGSPLVLWAGTIPRDAIMRILYVPPAAVVVL